MNVSVFGSARPTPGEKAYEEARKLGRLLATAGYIVLTGGYTGTMEAVSRGAAEANGHVIGVTCEEIERWRPDEANPWVAEEWRKDTLIERLHTLATSCDAVVALPGGIGTLAEIAVTWNLMRIASVQQRPLILVGPGWQITFEQLYLAMGEHIPEHQRGLIQFSEDIHATIAALESWKPATQE